MEGGEVALRHRQTRSGGSDAIRRSSLSAHEQLRERDTTRGRKWVKGEIDAKREVLPYSCTDY